MPEPFDNIDDIMREVKDRNKPRDYASYAIIAFLVGIIGFLTRPLWHDFIFGIWKYAEILNVFIITIIAIAYFRFSKKSWGETVQVAGITFVIAWLLFMFMGGLVTQNTMSQELQFTERDDLALVDSENPRILPQQVSDRFAQNTLQFPRHRLGVADITMRDGTPFWSYPLMPEGGVNRFVVDQKGAVFVDMTNSSRNLETIEFDMNPGVGMALWRDYMWSLRKDKYWAEHKDPIMIPFNDELYIATPYIEYELRVLPFLHTVPKWGGVALNNPDGSVTHLSPEEARNSEVLEGQRLYPFDLSYMQTNSRRFINGIVNFLFFHEDQLEIASITNHINDQPFFVPTQEGLKYFIAVEPYGDSAGIYQIWHFDARTGEIEVYSVHQDEAMLGPNRAADYVRRASPMIDWNRLIPAEPLPVVVDDKLYWMLRVIPRDGSGIAYTAFVDASSTNVLAFESDRDIIDFIRGDLSEDDVIVDDADDVVGDEVESDGDITISIFEDGALVSSNVISGDATIEIER